MNEREDAFRTLPERFDDEPGGHSMPGGHGMPGSGFHTLPERHDGMPGGHGMPGSGFHTLPEDFGPRGGMPGGRGFHGGPPMGPGPDFMKERIEQADLDELLMLAGRMARRRPEGDPAQGQNLILSILAGREALSQRALQQMLGIQPGSLSEILTKLERKGFLTREKAEDRRGNLLRITDAGRAALPDAEAPAADDRFSALTDRQQDQLAALLRTLLNDWAERFAPPPRGPERPDPRGGRLVPPPDQTIKV